MLPQYTQLYLTTTDSTSAKARAQAVACNDLYVRTAGMLHRVGYRVTDLIQVKRCLVVRERLVLAPLQLRRST